ncbi:MAG: tetratricopeptide repeat protein [Elusimicrobiota bacterium]
MNALSLLLLLCAPGVFSADTESARQAYDAGRYSEAAEAYERLCEATPRDFPLQYNLGNALFKSGKLGRAVASYERAFALDPRDHDVRFNLAFALKLAGEDFVPSGAPPVLFWIFTALSERELAGLHWLTAWTALSFAAVLLLSRDTRRETLAPWTAAAFSVWLVFALWWGGLRAALPPNRGVIVTPHAEVRHGPGPGFGVAFTVPEGRRVRVLGFSGAWLEVGILTEGAKGWIQASSVERL